MNVRSNLISELSKDCTPVKPLPNPLLRFVRWLLISCLCIGAGVSLVGIRQDVKLAVSNMNFIVQSLFIFGLSLSSALGAFMLSVPSERKSAWAKYFPIVPVGLWLCALFLNVGVDFVRQVSFEFGMNGMYCFGEIILFALVPAALIFAMLRKAAPINQTWSGFLALISAGSLAAIGSQLTCSSTDPLHLLIWHYLPVVSIGWFGVILGKKLLKW